MTKYQTYLEKRWRENKTPFTPLHWGPSSWIGLILFKIFDFPTLLISCVIVDVEPFCVFIFNAPWPLHGFLHTFLGGSIVAIITAIILYFLKKPIKKLMSIFKLSQDSSFKKIILTSFFGVFSHILLDAFLYEEMNPFYPFKGNPFLGLFSSFNVYLFCSLSFLIGVLIYLIRLSLIRKNLDNENQKY